MRIAIPLAIAAVFALARRYLPVSSIRVQPREGTVDELDSRFAPWQWVVSAALVVVGICFFVGAYAALVALNRYFATHDGAPELILYPQTAIWWFLPIFGALALSWEITLQLVGLFGGRALADSYNHWSSLKWGYDSTRVMRWIALFVVVPVAILTILALPMHVALRQDEIRDCGYGFSECQTYRYADAKRMTIIDGFRDRNGNLVRRAGIVIDFSDGRRWSSAEAGDFAQVVDPSLRRFLIGKIGLSYEHAQTEKDIPHWN